MKHKPKENEKEDGLTGDWNITFFQLQRNSLKIRHVRITTFRIKHWRIIGLKLSFYRQNWKRLALNIVNGLLANLNLHGEEFHNSAVTMKYKFLKSPNIGLAVCTNLRP